VQPFRETEGRGLTGEGARGKGGRFPYDKVLGFGKKKKKRRVHFSEKLGGKSTYAR